MNSSPQTPVKRTPADATSRPEVASGKTTAKSAKTIGSEIRPRPAADGDPDAQPMVLIPGRKPKRPTGRPRGSGPALRRAQALMQSDPSITAADAFSRAYGSPDAGKRALQKYAGEVASWCGVDPRERLREVCRYGAAPDRVSAAAALLGVASDPDTTSTGRPRGRMVFISSDTSKPGRVYELPRELEAFQKALLTPPRVERTAAERDRDFALGVLTEVLTSQRSANSTVVRAARELLAVHLPRESAGDETDEVIFVLPCNGRKCVGDRLIVRGDVDLVRSHDNAPDDADYDTRASARRAVEDLRFDPHAATEGAVP